MSNAYQKHLFDHVTRLQYKQPSEDTNHEVYHGFDLPYAGGLTITKITFVRIPGTTLTLCVLETECGLIYLGESMCQDRPQQFDAELGKLYAFQKALDHHFGGQAHQVCLERHSCEMNNL